MRVTAERRLWRMSKRISRPALGEHTAQKRPRVKVAGDRPGKLPSVHNKPGQRVPTVQRAKVSQ
jgi:hypothetical protein